MLPYNPLSIFYTLQMPRYRPNKILNCTPSPPNQCTYQLSTFCTSQIPRYSPDKILKVKVTTARSKFNSRSHHDVAYLHLLTNVPTKYQPPKPYGLCDTAPTRFSYSRLLTARSNHVSTSYAVQFMRYSPNKIFKFKVTMARSNQGQTMTLHTKTHHTKVPTKY